MIHTPELAIIFKTYHDVVSLEKSVGKLGKHLFKTKKFVGKYGQFP